MDNKELIKRRFGRTLHQYNQLAIVQREIADRLAERLTEVRAELKQTAPSNNRDVDTSGESGRGLEIGAGTGFLTQYLVCMLGSYDWVINDLSPESEKYLPVGERVHFVAGDGELMDFIDKKDGEFDLIASASVVQWFRELDLFVNRVAQNLRSGGMMAISTFGPDNFAEITRTTGDTLNYYALRQVEQMTRAAGLQVLHLEEWRREMLFSSPIDVLHHIKSTGVNAISTKRWTHRDLTAFETLYKELYSPIKLTFHPMIVIARKP